MLENVLVSKFISDSKLKQLFIVYHTRRVGNKIDTNIFLVYLNQYTSYNGWSILTRYLV